MKKAILLFALLLNGLFLSAQQHVKSPKKNGFYQKKNKYHEVVQSGMCSNGLKTGTWKYFDNSHLIKEEDFTDGGILIETREYKNDEYGKTEMFTEVDNVNQGKYVLTHLRDTLIVGWYTAGEKDKTWSYFRVLKGNNLWKNESWQWGIVTMIQYYYADGKLYELDSLNSRNHINSVTYYDEAGNELKLQDENDRLQKEKKDSSALANNLQRSSQSSSPTLNSAGRDTSHEKAATLVDQIPEFPGGSAAEMLFLQQNIFYPEAAREIELRGTVYISFRINEFGGVDQIHIVKSVPGGQLLEAEAIRVVSMMPPFTPGKIEGNAVAVQMVQPIKFDL